ncbi:ABC transporter ATP-binding protein [Acetobacter thailandicus]|uniref:ABC transporter ATP-binding protein n=1 Tax=Acetobacter thailandicus TaxID=1502842 RepID=UPI001BA70CAA|nr:ABC transporter ATP-binding protein [Acetobacter thailandicus]MBS0961237.1 ABC transporter ATP-binding protein [Acetobacter thailandicus]
MSRTPYNPAVLRVSDLTIISKKNGVTIIDNLSLQVRRGEIVSLLGESGSGKSVTSLAIMGLTQGMTINGSITLEEQEITQFSEKEMRNLRGARVAMIFQNPMSSLNPVKTVGKQISEVLRRHISMSSSKAQKQAISIMQDVGLHDPERCYHAYAHQLSGGMCQRIMIAMAIACRPALLVADEPTTALDMTVQRQIMDVLTSLTSRYGMSVLFITHDLHLAQYYSDRTNIMYAGQIVEEGATDIIFSRPAHPYTQALIACNPDSDSAHTRFKSIPGHVPDLRELPAGCYFSPRCSSVKPDCTVASVSMVSLERGGQVRCNHPLTKKN